jgi:DNA-binding NtrC family response regulator
MASKTDPAYVVEVVGGDDDKATLLVDQTILTIGRARDADLPLRDPTVSRHHVQVLAAENGVQFAVCGTATRFLIDGRPFKRAEARVGQTVIVGKTSLKVRSVDVAESRAATIERTDVTGLLTGAIGDARGLADVHALIESLDAADDEEALLARLQTWTSEHDVASRVEVLPEDPKDAHYSNLVERREGTDSALVSVPVASERPVRLQFAVSARTLTDSKRRMLVVAGRVVGSAFERARRLEAAAREKDALRALHFGSARAFLGTSPAAQHLSSLVPRLSASDVSVLLEGETGVGKTFFARLIHEAGRRSREPLRILNCASIPETLLESELFGHERGAFTGAAAPRAGALESAGTGTLFLDEVGELSLASQAKLLRALEEKRFERLGSNRTLELRARVLTATNRDLVAMAKDGRFRSDLLYRISVVKVTIPPLRERGEDLVLLAKQLLADLSVEAHRRVTGFSETALEAIRRYPWPGNVRELRNAIEHAIVLGEEPLIQEQDFPAGIQARPGESPDRGSVALLVDAGDGAERKSVAAALLAAGGNRTRAAAILGVSRVTFYKRLRQL